MTKRPKFPVLTWSSDTVSGEVRSHEVDRKLHSLLLAASVVSKWARAPNQSMFLAGASRSQVNNLGCLNGPFENCPAKPVQNSFET